MVTVPSGNHSPPLGLTGFQIILSGQFDGCLNSLRTPREEIDLLQPFGQDSSQSFCVFFDRLGGELCSVDIPYLAHLICHLPENFFPPVTKIYNQFATITVDITFSTFVLEIDPFTVSD